MEDSELDEPKRPEKGAPSQKAKTQKNGKSHVSNGTRLRVDNDEPMDLLEGAAGKFMSTSSILLVF